MADLPLHEAFASTSLDPRLRWQHAPPVWRLDTEASRLIVEPAAGTDYWQRTHYGFEADNGHFLHLEAGGDFVLTTQVEFAPRHQYDQAGPMLCISPQCWLKTSIEFEPEGPNRLGAVVTNAGWSDWSTRAIAQDVSTIWLRLRAEGHDAIVEASADGRQWEQLRMAHLHERAQAASVQCGLYACSPKSAGYRAAFAFLDFMPGRLG